VIDVGGTSIKLLATGWKEMRRLPSGPAMTAAAMVREVKNAVAEWDCDAVSIGYPGPVIHGRPLREPHNLAPGWVHFDFEKAFGCPVKILMTPPCKRWALTRGVACFSSAWVLVWVQR